MFLIDFSTLSNAGALQLATGKLAAAPEAWEKDIWQFICNFCDEKSGVIEVTTSGSTGTPKKIIHSKEHMLNSAAATCAALQITAGQTAFLCMPAAKIGGMMMIVRSIYKRLKLLCIKPSSTPLSDLPEDTTIDFAAFTPMQFHEIMNKPGAYQKAIHIKNILLGGQDVGGRLLHLIATMPNNIYHTFGMTETMSHIALKKLSGSAPEKYFTTLPGVTVESDERGCLIIHAPAIGQASLVTNDVANVISAQQFEWLGRTDHVINSGGLKLYPESIEQKLLPYLDKPFFVAGLPDDKLGTRLALFIESDLLSDAEKIKLEEGISTLEKYERPKESRLLKQFERTDTGKVNRAKSLMLPSA